MLKNQYINTWVSYFCEQLGSDNWNHGIVLVPGIKFCMEMRKSTFTLNEENNELK